MNDLLVPHGWDFKRLFAASLNPSSEVDWPNEAKSIVKLLPEQSIKSLADKSGVSVRQLQNYSRGAIPSLPTLEMLIDALDCFNCSLNLHEGYANWSDVMQSLLREQADAERAKTLTEAVRKRKAKLALAGVLAPSMPRAPTAAAFAPHKPPPAEYDPGPELDQVTLSDLPLDVEWIIDRVT